MIGSIKKIFAKNFKPFIDMFAFVQFWTNVIPKYPTQRRSLYSVEHLRWRYLWKQSTAESFIIDVWLGSEYASAILPLSLLEYMKLLNFWIFNPLFATLCSAEQMSCFYMKRKSRLKWINLKELPKRPGEGWNCTTEKGAGFGYPGWKSSTDNVNGYNFTIWIMKLFLFP